MARYAGSTLGYRFLRKWSSLESLKYSYVPSDFFSLCLASHRLRVLAHEDADDTHASSTHQKACNFQVIFVIPRKGWGTPTGLDPPRCCLPALRLFLKYGCAGAVSETTASSSWLAAQRQEECLNSCERLSLW